MKCTITIIKSQPYQRPLIFHFSLLVDDNVSAFKFMHSSNVNNKYKSDIPGFTIKLASGRFQRALTVDPVPKQQSKIKSIKVVTRSDYENELFIIDSNI